MKKEHTCIECTNFIVINEDRYRGRIIGYGGVCKFETDQGISGDSPACKSDFINKHSKVKLRTLNQTHVIGKWKCPYCRTHNKPMFTTEFQLNEIEKHLEYLPCTECGKKCIVTLIPSYVTMPGEGK